MSSRSPPKPLDPSQLPTKTEIAVAMAMLETVLFRLRPTPQAGAQPESAARTA
jgi:hypothetical protein